MSIDQVISAAKGKRGTMMDAFHLSLMENCFQASFRNVRLHFSKESHAANDALRSLAFVVEEDIYFRPGFDSSLGASFTYVLAHELSHVMQKRYGRILCVNQQGVQSNEQLEQEANSNAACVLMGVRTMSITPDSSALPRCYGPAGHYYTAFYTAAAAGYDFHTANAIAFYTQLPDLVSELDAKEKGYGWWADYGKTCLSTLESYPAHFFHAEREYWQHAADRQIDAMVLAWQVQAGLHSLTGEDAEPETEKRTRILNRYAPGTLEFGLAVHAFGDSFAHRDYYDGNKMYAAPFGHAVETINPLLRLESADPTDPDKIFKRQPLYLDYGERLYTIFTKKTRNKVQVDLNQHRSNLKDVASLQSDDAQASLLVAKILSIYRFSIDIYRPPGDTLPWNQFRTQTGHLQLDPAILDTALSCAAEWCGSATPFHISVHGDWKTVSRKLTRPVTQFVEQAQDTVLTVTGGNLTPMQFYQQLYGGMPFQ